MQVYLHLSVPGLALGTTCSQCSVSTGGKNGNASKPHGKLRDFTVLSAAALRDCRAWTLSAAAHEGLWAMPCNQQVLEVAVGSPPTTSRGCMGSTAGTARLLWVAHVGEIKCVQQTRGEVIHGSPGPALMVSSGTQEACTFLGSPELQKSPWPGLPLRRGSHLIRVDTALPCGPTTASRPSETPPQDLQSLLLPASSFPFSSSFLAKAELFTTRSHVCLASLLSTRAQTQTLDPGPSGPRMTWLLPPGPCSSPSPSFPRSPSRWAPFPPKGGGLVSAQPLA